MLILTFDDAKIRIIFDKYQTLGIKSSFFGVNLYSVEITGYNKATFCALLKYEI